MESNREKPITSYDVARKAGLSRSVVSRAFTEGAKVSEESRQKVFAAAEELGYRVNFLARGLKKQHSNLVGIVAADLDTPFRSRQVKIAAEECIRLGFRPILLTSSPNDEEAVTSLLYSYNIAGMIVTTATQSTGIIDQCNRFSIPIVMINRGEKVAGADCVQVDTQQAGRLAYEMLTSKGASKLALLHTDDESFSVSGRAISFQERCNRENKFVSSILAANQNYTSGKKAAAEVALQIGDIDGIFCTTDLLALGLIDGLRHDWGISIPEQIQVVGFDDIEQAAWESYRLSTIQQNPDEQAIQAVKLMSDRIKKPQNETVSFTQKLFPVFRSTTVDTK